MLATLHHHPLPLAEPHSRLPSVSALDLRTRQGDTASVLDLRNYSLSLGRRFRSLKLWFVLRSYGLQGFRTHLRRCIALAQRFEDRLDATKKFELVTPGSLALRVFQAVPPHTDNPTSDETQQFTRRFYEKLSTPEYTSRVLLTQTTLPGGVGYCIRFVVGSPLTREEHVDAAVGVLEECWRATAAKVAKGAAAT